MADMPGNPHYAEADIGRDYFEDTDNQRLTQATLALAYEQRTANLIAKLALSAQVVAVGVTTTPGFNAVDTEILARLGLDK